MEGLLKDLKRCGVLKSNKVYDAMKQVDRSDFTKYNAYDDSPQSISYNATISAPHMHCHALEYLEQYLTEGAHILDVGFGSGYLTVALSKMINDTGIVVGIEHIKELYEFGEKNIQKHHKNLLDSKKIILVNEDGRKGYKTYAPYKVIHVGAAAEEVPKELIDQLDKNGRMFIPVGTYDQWIKVIDKDKNGNISEKKVMGVRYVPLTSKEKQLKGY
jgi:protein-L-isoaspartate(D-aspartate) O-methyltransferase